MPLHWTLRGKPCFLCYKGIWPRHNNG
jgi:hypothetical protein